MTNKEFINQANEKELTELFMRFLYDADFKTRFVVGNFYVEFDKWLKQPHTSKE